MFTNQDVLSDIDTPSSSEDESFCVLTPSLSSSPAQLHNGNIASTFEPRNWPINGAHADDEGIALPRNAELSSDSFYDDMCLEYMAFTDDNPTTYHATAYFAKELERNGFKYLSERKSWDVPAGKYYTTREGKSLVAFVVGQQWTPAHGLGAIGSHIDALTAKLKPNLTKKQVHGYSLLGVAPYLGALNHLWLDRDLGVAGAVLYKGKDGKVLQRLVLSGRHPIGRIPSLAPHFGAISSLPYNTETRMVPVIGFLTEPEPTEAETEAPLLGRHLLPLLRYIANLAHVAVADIVQLDLDLYDVQAATRGGLSGEFFFAPRIDDRLCSFAAIKALVAHALAVDVAAPLQFLAVLLANHEEIGSGLRTGAKGRFLNSVVERVLHARNWAADLRQTFANSVILSADVTHALNPNFTDAYLDGHFPVPNTGLTVKMDAKGHVMTDHIGWVLMQAVALKCGLPVQQFHIRNDKPSGGTIGPMLAIDTGARVVDVGLAQLSMHSIRALAGYMEAGLGARTFRAFFDHWAAEYSKIET